MTPHRTQQRDVGIRYVIAPFYHFDVGLNPSSQLVLLRALLNQTFQIDRLCLTGNGKEVFGFLVEGDCLFFMQLR